MRTLKSSKNLTANILAQSMLITADVKDTLKIRTKTLTTGVVALEAGYKITHGS